MANSKSGVYKARKNDKSLYYRVFLAYKNKSLSLGSFDNEKDAKDAYEDALMITSDAGITLRDYTDVSKLSFDKWVSLINYRDNNIYFANPIYLRPGLFYYYLSPEEILKFDLDDLFFYSSHKIMRRQGHMFVSNFGSQLSIFSKYGIKANAVVGRDYNFINGDNLDFRYSNIELLNTYNGVEIINAEDGLLYKAYIHVNGNYIIGTYDTIEKAAIAYNKAADMLIQKGIGKKYALNKISGMSPKEYAHIYLELEISDKIINYQV